jgi:hypothetical protein
MDSTLLECVWLRDPNAEHGVCTHSPVQFSVKVCFNLHRDRLFYRLSEY